jgi:DNA-binding transcriptional regulator YiaG
MTSPEMRPMFDSTSAAGAMLVRQLRNPVLVGSMLAGLGTSSAHAVAAEIGMRSPRPLDQTSAGASIVLADRAGPAIAELRRSSGFTWDQLARLFNVTRRSLHFWASGKAMTPSNEEHLQRLLAVIRKIDRGSASANRTALLTVREDGTIPFDLLAAEEYERVVNLLGAGETRRARAPKLSADAMAARAPRPPEDLVGALQDRIHPASGRLLAAKAVRVPRRK